MQRLAVRSLQARLACLQCPPSYWQRPKLFSTAAPPNPSQISSRKRVVTVVVAFLGGLSFYFVLPDPSRAAPTYQQKPLSARHFTPATVIANEDSGPDTKLLRISVKPEILARSDPNGFKAAWSVFIKDDDIQVERPYTPLYGIDEHGHMLFWIKKYPRGEVGRWLHTKVPGDKIELRGPLTTWGWKEDTWDEVIMISGGTGITPFVQLFHSVISNLSVSPSTQFRLLHSSKNPEELPPSSLLKPILRFSKENPDRLKTNLFVDTSDQASPDYDLSVTRINEEAVKKNLGIYRQPLSWWKTFFNRSEPEPLPKRRLFLVCGPEPMVAAVAGPYGRNMSQGQVGGVLGKLGYTTSEVYKL
ncbi:ferredoxin reductase-like protein [Coprinopsis marcescibilis]|uniref:Ferredoxin reductase-like protein n=1 Tax=Coprinopsis marcescibilis TaxID=230819 RepID=A0A5C3L360_COPMA|nr:ferredoxin reductase-like protein [Coprinopsis marcescibilis]